MKRTKTSLLWLGLILLPAGLLAEVDEIPIGGGDEEAELRGALESPEEAARHQRALETERGASAAEAAPPPVVSPPPVTAPPPPPPPQASPVDVGDDVDLALGSEPEWLRKGGDPEKPPAYRLRPQRPKVRVTLSEDGKKIIAPPFIFNAWSANLSATDREVLDQIATLMKEKPAGVPKLRIEAYTDNSGDPAINESLTIARAHVVKAFLILKGVGVHRLEAKGFGEAKPLESNETKAGRAKNRRVEFKILK